MLNEALAYAKQGWPVFPVHYAAGTLPVCSCGKDCSSPAKHPMTRNGLKDATLDLERIERWWTRHPDSNIGLPTGINFDVFDIDDMTVMTAEQIRLVTTMTGPAVLTGGYGQHCYVQPAGLGNRTKFIPGCDWRGRGGYVLAPPSSHISGNNYSWLEDFGAQTDIEPCPKWLFDLLFPPPPERIPAVQTNRTNTSTYGQKALEGEVLLITGAPEGTRNHTLNVAAYNLGQLVAGGALNGPETFTTLVNAAVSVGLTEKESVATVQSGFRKGAEKPRRP